MNEFTGLVAIVTGGGSGIGAATAALLTERGARVAILDRDVPSGDRVAAMALTCDVTFTPGVEKAISAVVETLGGIDIVVNNAGIGATGDIARR